eukprot:TRINITY_DN8388_c0_g2_i1.p1 TRINITY_DN8388_c0_g2~~TRINITY_DN8388_c0_g2_i1.p1  ORF type:complete len:318 (-),score=40.48 TRINITY_DN8388_c0_g2_i1:176-1129(-)
MDVNWVIAAIAYVLGCGVITVGENLVRRSSVPSTSSWSVWSIGCFIFLIGNATHFIAFGYAPQSTLEMLGCSVLVWNLALAPVFNQELILREHLIGTLIIFAGTILALNFAPHASKSHTMAELPQLVLRPQFVIYEFVAWGLAMVLQVVYLREEWRSLETKEEIGSTTRSALGPVAFVVSSAIVGAHGVLLSKSLSESLHIVESETNVFWPLGLVLGYSILTGFWVYRLNRALCKYPALFVVPVVQASWMSVTIVSGGIYFEEFRSFSPLEVVLFGVCVGIILFGMFMMPVDAGHVRPELLSENNSEASSEMVTMTR